MKKHLSGLLLLLLIAPLQAIPMEEADKLLADGKFDAAIELMRQEVAKNEKDPYLFYNFGLTLYRAERYDEAIRVFQSLDAMDNKDLQSKAALQMGNIQYRLAQKLLLPKTKNPAGAILSMERSLGYYQRANEVKASKESTANLKTATSQLGTTLLDVADGADKHAVGYSASGNLRFEETSLRDALQARQRAAELDSANTQIQPLISQTTARLVANLNLQATQLAKEADEAKDTKTAKGRRQQAIAKYDDALQFDPQNTQLAAARADQVKKMANLLTDEAQALAEAALQKPSADLDKKDQASLEQAKTKLDDALSLDSTNSRAADLKQKVFKKLDESYTAEGDKALADAATTLDNKGKLAQVKIAADQFQKALNQNPDSQSAQSGLKNAQAQLPGLYATVGKEDLAAAKGMMAGGATQPKALSNDDLKATTSLLNNSVQKLDTAVSLQPTDTASKKSLAEAQQLLDAVNAENDKRNMAAGAASGAAAPGPQGDNGQGSGGKMLPLSLSNFGSQKPVTESKFWDKKIKDW